MNHFVDGTFDRAHALALAASVCRRGARELSALAETNPDLLRDWLDELTRCRDRTRDEADQLSAVVGLLQKAQRAPSREAA